MMAGLVLVTSLITLATAYYIDEPLESDYVIDLVNKKNTTWQAGRNFHPSTTNQAISRLFGLKDPAEGMTLPLLEDDAGAVDLDLPAEFDARKKWDFCKTLLHVRDQGGCGSCWAFSTTSAFSDRLCIATKGRFNVQLSAQDLITCSADNNGCSGGVPAQAWKYFQDTGICTGGGFQSGEGCQPYTIEPCEHDVPGPRKQCTEHFVPTPQCKTSCYNKEYNLTKEHDIHKVKKMFSIENLAKKKKEIFTHGPIEANFEVYQDFLSYKSGVYKYTTGELEGGHSVKVIGWGTEHGEDYWLVANSWNSDWGENGFFKISVNDNGCRFGVVMTGGYPDV